MPDRGDDVLAEWYSGSFQILVFTSVEPTINRSFGFPPDAPEGLPPGRYSVRYKGYLQPLVSGLHRFGPSFIGGTVQLNGQTISREHYPTELYLEAGMKYELKYDYIPSDNQPRQARLHWMVVGRDRSLQRIPQSQLFSAPH